MSKTIAELRAEAKELGINTFQMGAAEIEAAIAAAEGGAEPVTETPKDETPKQPTDAEIMAAFTMKMVQDAKAELEQLKQAKITMTGKRKSTPEEEIIKRHTSHKAKIAAQEKVRITIPGGLMGMPERYTSVVDGHMCEVFPGVPKDIPLAHYENLMLSFEQARKNALKSAKLERVAMGLATK